MGDDEDSLLNEVDIIRTAVEFSHRLHCQDSGSNVDGHLLAGSSCAQLVKDSLQQFVDNRSWSDLILGAILGAVVGLLVTSFATPFLNPHVTRFYEDAGYYSGPSVTVEIRDTGEYHPPNSSVDDFGGLRWKENHSVFRVQIRNDGSKAVNQLEFIWRVPGCVVYSNTDGPSAGGEYSLQNRATYGIFSNVSLDLDRYQCTKLIKVVDGELSPSESLATEFVVTSKFDRCDVLVDLNPRNLHLLTYQWEENGVRFNEERPMSPDHLEAPYREVQNTTFVGTRESLTMSSGEYIHNFVVGVRGNNLEEAIKKCPA
jgi:hypothetical protein